MTIVARSLPVVAIALLAGCAAPPSIPAAHTVTVTATPTATEAPVTVTLPPAPPPPAVEPAACTDDDIEVTNGAMESAILSGASWCPSGTRRRTPARWSATRAPIW